MREREHIANDYPTDRMQLEVLLDIRDGIKLLVEERIAAHGYAEDMLRLQRRVPSRREAEAFRAEALKTIDRMREAADVLRKELAVAEKERDRLRDENESLRFALSNVKPVGADVLDALRAERDNLKEQLEEAQMDLERERNDDALERELRAELRNARVVAAELQQALFTAEAERDASIEQLRRRGEVHP